MTRADREEHARQTYRLAVRRIREEYAAADREDTLDGMVWYADAHDVARALAAGSGYSVGTVCDLIAVLSPQTDWRTNKRRAARVLELDAAGIPTWQWPNELGCTSWCATAAARILAGDLMEDVTKGRKVRRFAQNLRGDWHPVTVDTWVARIVWGRDHDGKMTATEYLALERACQDVAAEHDVPPAALQAVVWVSYRHGHARVQNGGHD